MQVRLFSIACIYRHAFYLVYCMEGRILSYALKQWTPAGEGGGGRVCPGVYRFNRLSTFTLYLRNLVYF